MLKQLHFCIQIGDRHHPLPLPGVDREKIHLKNVRDTDEKLDVYVVLLENLVDIGTCTAELAGEPCNRPSLFLKRLLYQLSYMYHLHEKAWESYFAHSDSQAFACPLKRTSNAESPRRYVQR